MRKSSHKDREIKNLGTPSDTTHSPLILFFLLPRYLAEFATGNDRKEAAENSLVAYKAASDIAMTELPPTHPIRCENSPC